MSEVMVLASDLNARCACDDCGWKGTAGDLGMMPDFEDRVCAGEIVPAGQCPECHVLVHLVKRPDGGAVDDITARVMAEALDAMLDAYAPRREETIRNGGRKALHSAVKLAIDALETYREG